jgi:hypothetical protein
MQTAFCFGKDKLPGSDLEKAQFSADLKNTSDGPKKTY